MTTILFVVSANIVYYSNINMITMLYFFLINRYDPDKVIEGLYNEVQWYDYDRSSCEPQRVCGHYTQVISHTDTHTHTHTHIHTHTQTHTHR